MIGAGAAGLATGIFLGRAAPGTRIVALDGARRIGAKILVAGGGRCNVTNARVTPADFYGGNRNILKRTLRAFPAGAARAFFEEIGVALHEEEHGKLFPDSNSARTVVAALLAEADRRGVRIVTGQRVTALERSPDGFVLTTAGDAAPHRWTARRVVLATGGLSLPKTGSDGGGYALARGLGHTLVPTTPALDPLVLASDWHEQLSGISHEVLLEVRVSGTRPVRIPGSLLWTHFGISGPAALNSSRFWNRATLSRQPVRISVNLLGGRDFSEAERDLLARADAQPRLSVARILRDALPQRVAGQICTLAGIGPEQPIGQVRREDRRRLLHALTDLELPVTRSRGYRYAEVTAGGIPLAEIDAGSFCSRCCPGLYLVGEVLDVDGRIGGFNFQWAWASAFVAARALAAGFR